MLSCFSVNMLLKQFKVTSDLIFCSNLHFGSYRVKKKRVSITQAFLIG